MKFPQGEGSAVIHRKKNRPALQRRDILTVFLVSFFCFYFFIGNLLNSSFTQFLVVLLCLEYSTQLRSLQNTSFNGFFLGLCLPSYSFLLLLLLSVTAFSYVGLFSLFWVRPFHALYLSHLPPSSFLDGSSEQFAEVGSVHLLIFSARVCSLAFLSSASPFWTICRAVFVYLVLFRGVVLRPFSLEWFRWFQLLWGLIFLIFLRDFSCVFDRAFFLSGSVLSSRPALSSENACS